MKNQYNFLYINLHLAGKNNRDERDHNGIIKCINKAKAINNTQPTLLSTDLKIA
jgi:hypothetical protein